MCSHERTPFLPESLKLLARTHLPRNVGFHGNTSVSFGRQVVLSVAGAAGLPRSWPSRGLLGEAPVMQIPLADLVRFEDQHNQGLGSYARNIKAIAPEVRQNPPETTSSCLPLFSCCPSLCSIVQPMLEHQLKGLLVGWELRDWHLLRRDWRSLML